MPHPSRSFFYNRNLSPFCRRAHNLHMAIRSPLRIGIAFCVLLPLVAVGQQPAVENANISEAEYAVFSAYISQSFVGAVGKNRIDRPISQIVIVNLTESDKNDLDDFLDPNDPPPGGRWKSICKKKRRHFGRSQSAISTERMRSRKSLRLTSICLCHINS